MSQAIELDVRVIPPRDKHPTIFRNFDSLLSGQSMLLVDHDMGLVLGICDEVVVLEFGKVIAGMEVADALNSEYGEAAGSGIRAGKQEPLFQMGNAYLERHFPRLDCIQRATVIEPTGK